MISTYHVLRSLCSVKRKQKVYLNGQHRRAPTVVDTPQPYRECPPDNADRPAEVRPTWCMWKVKTAIDEVSVLHRRPYSQCNNFASTTNTKYRMLKSVVYSVCLTVNDKYRATAR